MSHIFQLSPVTSPGTVTCHQVWTTCHLVPPPRNTNTHRNFRKALSPSIIGIPLFIPVSLQHITQPAFCCVKLLLKGLQSLNISQTVCTVSSNNFQNPCNMGESSLGKYFWCMSGNQQQYQHPTGPHQYQQTRNLGLGDSMRSGQQNLLNLSVPTSLLSIFCSKAQHII